MNYQPKLNISDGAWYAARPIPGTDGWHGEVLCPSKDAAQRACDELNGVDPSAQRGPAKLQLVLGEKTKGKNDAT